VPQWHHVDELLFY